MSRNSISSWMYYVGKHVFEYQMPLRIIDTQLCVKGMKNIGKLWHVLVPSLPQHDPLYVFTLIASDRVVLLLDGIP